MYKYYREGKMDNHYTKLFYPHLISVKLELCPGIIWIDKYVATGGGALTDGRRDRKVGR